MNEKTNSNSMRNMNKNNTSVLIQRLWYSTKRNETMNDFPVIGHPCFAYRILGLYQERLQNFSRVLSRSTLLGWGFKRFRYPFILQIFPATVAFQIKDLITAFIDIYSFLLSAFSWSSVIFSSINFAFSFIWEQSSSRDFCFPLTATMSISMWDTLVWRPFTIWLNA